MNTTRWTRLTEGGATHAFDATPDLLDPDGNRVVVVSVCGHASVLQRDLAGAAERVDEGDGCAFCRRALGMPRRAVSA